MSKKPENKIFTSGISTQTTPLSKAKSPLSWKEIKTIKDRFSVPNWQSAGDDGVYVNMHLNEFVNVDMAMPTHTERHIPRAINPELGNTSFQLQDGSQTPTLEEYLADDYNRVQGVMMAHQGKVIFEAYPGMNPNDYHIWMSTSKTTVGTLCILLESEGLIDLEKPVSFYATDLKGTAWDEVSMKDALNMATGLDLEETTAAFSDPHSWIEQFFGSLFSRDPKSNWLGILRTVKPIEGEKPGDRFRYSTAVTQALTLAIQEVTGHSFKDVFNAKIWSKIGVGHPFMVGNTGDGVAVGGGTVNTTLEDALKYAMMYTPSWHVVSSERVITPEILERIRTLGDPKAYQGSEEEQYSLEWTGDLGERNATQWDQVWADGAMFKHGNMHQGIYVDADRDFCAFVFATSPNERSDKMPGFMRAVAKRVAGK
ncbi:serine hydrolase domain-containing protein [Persicobacter diffluens]|uniref:6-aminohexanoate-dimer hydrolase n=1 Tax=Persicobacter diffluens TaxID=981 RepID=A0AAN4W5M7_9BACT|nr:6-aminohexanoate-dimer hydrolase [Persicobacter diffluens]